VVSDDVSGGRFLDRGRPLAAYADLIHVVCPACGGQAVVVPCPGLPALRYLSELQFRPRRLVGSPSYLPSMIGRADAADQTLGGFVILAATSR
jgi:hypothetical protein